VTTLLLLFVTLLGGAMILISLRPDAFRVSRSAVIDAPAEAVFAQIVDFHNWRSWSPWAERDPDAKSVFEGPESGVSASFAWDGDAKVGAGKMTIVECVREERLRIRIEFLRPMKAVNLATFKLVSTEGRTQIAWSMEGKNNFLAKAFSLFLDCEEIIGRDFEKGLANLKALVEAANERSA
jgi:hypothetical protein